MESVARWRAARVVLVAAVVGIATWYVALGAAHQWDFETYYYAASAYRTGLDPYSLESLSTVAGRPIELPFLYPPITLLVFLPFTYLPIHQAGGLWLALKCTLALVLVAIWWRVFLRPTNSVMLTAVALLGFNLALLWDLRTGNVALVEELLLWFAFAAYVHGKRFVSVCLIVVASLFKIYPILFLGLGLVPTGSRRGEFRLVALGLLLFLGLVTPSMLRSPGWAPAISDSLRGDQPTLTINSSAPGIIDSLLLVASVPSQASAWLGPILYAVYCLLLVWLSGPLLLRVLNSGSPHRVVYAAVFLWLLLAPRIMMYTYVMAVVPSLIAIRTFSSSGRAVAIGLMLAPGIVRLLPGKPPGIVGALPFLLVLWLWIVFASRGTIAAVGPSSPPRAIL